MTDSKATDVASRDGAKHRNERKREQNAVQPFDAREKLGRTKRRLPNPRLLAFNETGIAFRYKGYKREGPEHQRVMNLNATSSITFVGIACLPVLPAGAT